MSEKMEFQPKNEIQLSNALYALGVVKHDSGIFHLGEKFYKSEASLIATFVLFIIMVPYIISEFMSFGTILG